MTLTAPPTADAFPSPADLAIATAPDSDATMVSFLPRTSSAPPVTTMAPESRTAARASSMTTLTAIEPDFAEASFVSSAGAWADELASAGTFEPRLEKKLLIPAKPDFSLSVVLGGTAGSGFDLASALAPAIANAPTNPWLEALIVTPPPEVSEPRGPASDVPARLPITASVSRITVFTAIDTPPPDACALEYAPAIETTYEVSVARTSTDPPEGRARLPTVIKAPPSIWATVSSTTTAAASVRTKFDSLLFGFPTTSAAAMLSLSAVTERLSP